MKKITLSLAFILSVLILSTSGAFAAQESGQEPRMMLAAQAAMELSRELDFDEDQQKMLSARLNEMADPRSGFVNRDTARSVAEGIQAMPTQAGPAPVSVGEVEEKEEGEELSSGKKKLDKKNANGKKTKTGDKKSKYKPGDSQKKLKAKTGTTAVSRRALEAMSRAKDAKDGGQLDPRSKLFEQLGKHVAGFEPTIVLPWNIQFAPGEVSQIIDGMQGRQMRVSANGHYLALFTGYGEDMMTNVRQARFEIWDMQLMQKVRDVAIDTGRHDIAHWALSPAGDRLAFFADNTPRGIIFDVQRETGVCIIHAAPNSIQFTHDGSRLAVYTSKPRSATEWDTSILTYDATTGQLLDTKKATDILPATKDQRSLVFSPDQTKLVIYHRPAPFIEVWDVTAQKQLLRMRRNDDREYSSVTLDNSGSKLAVYSIDKIAIEGRKNRYIEIWNTQDGEKIAQIRLTTSVNNMALSPDGSVLATATVGSPVIMWNLEELERQYREAEAKRLAE
jgi:hypothetical protein